MFFGLSGRDSESFAYRVRAVLPASLPVVWETFTDYGNLSSFFPYVRETEVIEQRPAAAIVVWKVELMKIRAAFTLAYEERPARGEISWTLVNKVGPELRTKGAVVSDLLKSIEGRCLLRPTSDGRKTQIDYWTSFDPIYSPPRTLVEWYMRRERGRLVEVFRTRLRELDADRERLREAGLSRAAGLVSAH